MCLAPSAYSQIHFCFSITFKQLGDLALLHKEAHGRQFVDICRYICRPRQALITVSVETRGLISELEIISNCPKQSEDAATHEVL